ncbi:hypothetical protein BU24DRAFT_281460 [Aaosphaeria arxii CBS 175.79]|uniref:Uncharacterized protein n=1 Tax=Aaosphaeria arxii CBS 175.79 TaxID=1450172 RepID=A0A6A5XEG5_9PLEO|nr:uncharacterized protein BU24DRAFT_281460 [Aaosphaeria arxii CBS 175.79]KAF2011458.1 hypothetical protein BU24DRAFT_281460 [Aaosphaeria arxii CBS 175.79]
MPLPINKAHTTHPLQPLTPHILISQPQPQSAFIVHPPHPRPTHPACTSFVQQSMLERRGMLCLIIHCHRCVFSTHCAHPYTHTSLHEGDVCVRTMVKRLRRVGKGKGEGGDR